MVKKIHIVSNGDRKKGLTTGWAITIIVIIIVVIAGVIAFWYFLTIPKTEVSTDKLSTSATKSASASAGAYSEAGLTKTYQSTSTCISKFSFEYPKNWIIFKNYSVVDLENGGEGGGCLIDIQFLEKDKKDKNINSPLNVRVRAYSNISVPINIDEAVSFFSGVANFSDLITNPLETKDIKLGGIATKQYHLFGLMDWYYIGMTKDNSYYQIELQDPTDDYKNDRGSKTGYETIVNTWKFL